MWNSYTCMGSDISVVCVLLWKAESFQVDEENQANTLVSVAPLPQEPLDKPTVNGESPPENGTNPAPTTNGHSATQTPVADTEMWIMTPLTSCSATHWDTLPTSPSAACQHTVTNSTKHIHLPPSSPQPVPLGTKMTATM